MSFFVDGIGLDARLTARSKDDEVELLDELLDISLLGVIEEMDYCADGFQRKAYNMELFRMLIGPELDL